MNITVKQRTKFAAARNALNKADDYLQFLANEPGLHRIKITLERLRRDTLRVSNEIVEVVRRHA